MSPTESASSPAAPTDRSVPGAAAPQSPDLQSPDLQSPDLPPATGNDRVDEALAELAADPAEGAGSQAARLAAAHEILAGVLEQSRNPLRPDMQNPIPGLQPGRSGQ